MAKKRRRRKKQGKVVIKQQAKLVHKGDSIGRDSLPKAPTQMPRDNGINMRIKIKRKR